MYPILPYLAALCAIAEARTSVQQPFLGLAASFLPDDTCSVTALLNPHRLCQAQAHHSHSHSRSHSHINHSHKYHNSHQEHNANLVGLDLDALFSDFTDPVPSAWTDISDCIPSLETNETYCVFTNTSFSNDRGISFFTSPAIASRVALLPAFTTPQSPSINAHLTSSPSDLPYIIRNIPGRGNGMFASRNLTSGDVIIEETPLGVYMSDAFWPDYDSGYETLRKAFDWLPERTKDEFESMSMHNEGHPIMERINTNAFAGALVGEEGTEEKPHFWVHPRTAMFNHDCRPNAMYHHDPETLVHSTIAATNIAEGEEITITYIDLLEPREKRLELLQVWGFSCTCPQCKLSNHANLASEARVAKIGRYQNMLADWSSSSGGTPEMAEELMKLYEKEKLWSAIGTGHMYAALAWNAAASVADGYGKEGGVGEKEKRAVWHARRSVEIGTLASGAVENNRKEMSQLAEKPREHWSWGLRA